MVARKPSAGSKRSILWNDVIGSCVISKLVYVLINRLPPDIENVPDYVEAGGNIWLWPNTFNSKKLSNRYSSRPQEIGNSSFLGSELWNLELWHVKFPSICLSCVFDTSATGLVTSVVSSYFSWKFKEKISVSHRLRARENRGKKRCRNIVLWASAEVQ